MSAYPIKSDFIKNNLFGENETDSKKIQVCVALTDALNQAYLKGKEDGKTGVNRLGKIARIGWTALIKSNMSGLFRNRNVNKIIVDMIKEAYTEGYEEQGKGGGQL